MIAAAPSGRYLVTGAATGIGAAVTRRLLDDGAQVWGLGLDDDRGIEMQDSARHRGQDLTFRSVDLTDEGAVAECFAALDQAGDGLRGVVNCAGVYPLEQRLESMPVDEFRRVFEVNLMSTFLVCRAALPILRRGGGGVIVNVSSVHAVAAAPGQGAYAASKGAIVALTRQLAVDYARDGIRANSIMFGSVDTRMTRDAIARSGSVDKMGLTTDPMALGRIAQADEAAGVVALLLSDDARFITASAVLADGGLTASIL